MSVALELLVNNIRKPRKKWILFLTPTSFPPFFKSQFIDHCKSCSNMIIHEVKVLLEISVRLTPD